MLRNRRGRCDANRVYHGKAKRHRNIVVLGPLDVPRLPILSFLVRFGPAPTTFVHSAFVASLLNSCANRVAG